LVLYILLSTSISMFSYLQQEVATN